MIRLSWVRISAREFQFFSWSKCPWTGGALYVLQLFWHHPRILWAKYSLGDTLSTLFKLMAVMFLFYLTVIKQWCYLEGSLDMHGSFFEEKKFRKIRKTFAIFRKIRKNFEKNLLYKLMNFKWRCISVKWCTYIEKGCFYNK
jgi:hypothetical protein